MPITNVERRKEFDEANHDAYGGCCVNVAREVMRLLDEQPGEINPHDLICKADDNIDGGGITGFMACCVAQMVSLCHSRGEEFRKAWNLSMQIGTKGKKANEQGGVLNPALLNAE